jgi:hypothetical protein
VGQLEFFKYFIGVADPESGMGKKSPDHISESLETIFLGLKYFNSLMRIRDPGWKKFGSGMKKVRIRAAIIIQQTENVNV